MQVNNDSLVDKASRLFAYLSARQALREKTITENSAYVRDGGWVKRLEELAIAAEESSEIELSPQFMGHSSDTMNDSVIMFHKPKINEFPQPSKLQAPWIEGEIDSIHGTPHIRSEISSKLGTRELAKQGTEFKRSLEEWLQRWNKWKVSSETELIYQRVFEVQTSVNQFSDEFELVLAFGIFSWEDPDGNQFERQLFTTPLEITLDKYSGDIELRISTGQIKPELDVLPTVLLEDGNLNADVRDEIDKVEGNLLSEETFHSLGEVIVNSLGPTARYVDTIERNAPRNYPVVSWTPTVVMRKRQRIGLSKNLEEISKVILESGSVPAGLVPLIDPNRPTAVSASALPGAIFETEDEFFTTLPLNERQKDVLRRVDTNAQTIVQGPPGTGKTHMAAALLSHLLAQGKRVLVTAEKERALYELKGKLPREIQELAVSVITSDSQDMAELKVAIETITRRADEFSDHVSKARINELEGRLRVLREQRTAELRKWTTKMNAESAPLEVDGIAVNMADLVREWQESRTQYEWIGALREATVAEPFPLNSTELSEWFELLSDRKLEVEGVVDNADDIDLALLPSASEFDRLVDEHRKHEELVAHAQSTVDEKEYEKWSQLPATSRDRLRSLVSRGQLLETEVDSFNTDWKESIVSEFRAGNGDLWKQRYTLLKNEFSHVAELADQLTELNRISVTGEIDEYYALAKSLLEFLNSGGNIKTRPDGMPKIGLLTKPIIKDSLPVFEAVRINGAPPVTGDALNAYVRYVEFWWALDALQKSWPEEITVPSEISPAEHRLLWQKRIQEMQRTIEIVSELMTTSAEVRAFKIADWKSFAQAVLSILDFESVDSALSSEDEAGEQIRAAGVIVREMLHTLGAQPWLEDLDRAVHDLDTGAFKTAIGSATGFIGKGQRLKRRNYLSALVRGWSSELEGCVLLDREKSDEWLERLRHVEAAQRWRKLGELIRNRTDTNLGTISREVSLIEKEIGESLRKLAAERAWSQALDHGRIDNGMKTKLHAYTQAVKRLGKGTGKYADRHRRDIRKHLEACRSAVPVWIMPIYKVVEQFGLEENMFDVIIVDEASQANVDAVFLQYLAPRMVVIGDDKQVSPTVIGNKEEQFQLANQYLSDFEMIDAWTDAERSLFDDALMRYDGRITLVEHRRCVPEIIGFSNRYIYEPENIHLEPVREVEFGRLAPFKITRTPNAVVTSKKKVNRAEADVLVARLIDVLNNPVYEGKTIGVISLLSTSGQSQYLQARLQEKLSPEVWAERDLKVGSPADFQGAERDVIFLSMVQPSSPGKRISTLTRLEYQQRYNVAVSRAKDQVWLFHSVGVEELNPQDVRAQLLTYAYEVAEAQPEEFGLSLVSNEERVEPFDSLFEQKVFNQLVTRGFEVHPQFEAAGYRIDLVIQGKNSRLAVECDGDHWHGDSAAAADRLRQRNLERLGWKFIRIFESDYYLDPQEQMKRVWDELERLGIQPYESSETIEKGVKNVEVIDGGFVEAEDTRMSEREAFEPELQLHDEKDKNEERMFFGEEEQFAPTVVESDDLPPSVPVEVDYSPFDLTIEDPLGDAAESHLPVGIEQIPRDSQSSLQETAPIGSSIEISLKPYNEFDGNTVFAEDARASVIAEGLIDIIRIEGPITGSYLFSRFVKASGNHRVTKVRKRLLNSVLHHLVQERSVEISNPMEQAGYVDAVFRIPGTEKVVVRERGAREIHDMPFDELHEILRLICVQSGTNDAEVIMRRTLDLLGLVRLTPKTESLLRKHLDKLQREGFEIQ